MNYLMPKMVPTFLPLTDIKTVFEDQHIHLIKPTIASAAICLETPDPRQQLIYAPAGSGKTTTFQVDLFWRIASMAKKQFDKKNQLFVFTSPDDTINQEVFEQLNVLFSSNDIYEILEDAGLNFLGIYQDPKDVKGRGLEIVACSIQKLTQEQHKHIKKFNITALISDEAHRGLGSPDEENYKDDVGYEGSSYEAKWYWKCRELKYNMWFGLTGTPTASQKFNKTEYAVISDKMEKSDWRLPFFQEKIYVFRNEHTSHYNQIEEFFLELSKRNAIGKYIKSQIKDISSIDKLSETKVTGLIRCGISTSKYPLMSEVVSHWKKLCEKYKDQTFEYDGIQLSYYIGRCGELSSKFKPGGTNLKAVNILNDENNDVIAYAVMYIGSVGINVTNLGVTSILPQVKNAGNVDNNLRQFIARMDRSKFIWRGSFAMQVAQISDSKQRELMIKLAVNTSSCKCLATDGGLSVGAYVDVRDNHVLVHQAEGFLKGLVSIFREHSGNSSVGGKERDLAYKNARKTKCEFKNCGCYEELVENSDAKTKSIRELAYQRMLQVDHKDGDRENMDIKNLITLCPNRHSIKTMENEDFLNEYK